MIKSVTITNSIGESINFELTNPWKNGVAIKSITGLGTPMYSVNTLPYASGDGSLVGNVIANTRNIVFEFYPLFNPMVEDSRQLLYRYFQVKKEIIMTFELDNRVATIAGYLEENTPDIFSERETIQISVICPDVYFKEDFASSEFFYGEVPMFEFPFSNESLTEKLILISDTRLDDRGTIEYNGEIDAGLLITVDCYSDTGNINIYSIDTLGGITINSSKVQKITGKPITEKDQIRISTYSGDKYVTLLREGRYYDIIGAINKNIEWFTLKQGPNTFAYTTGSKDASIILGFRYRNTYASI